MYGKRFVVNNTRVVVKCFIYIITGSRLDKAHENRRALKKTKLNK